MVQTGSDAKTVYTTSDHLGSPRINTDATGQVISRHDYHPFGEEIARTGYGSDTIRKQFTGYERDGETGLDFAQARYYAKALGRFQSPDEFFNDQSPGMPQTWNLYAYVTNNPLVFVDTAGKWKEVPCSGGNSGGRSCYESDRADDTYQSLAELLGVPHQFLGAFFGSGLDANMSKADEFRRSAIDSLLAIPKSKGGYEVSKSCPNSMKPCK